MFGNPGKKLAKAGDQAVDRKVEEALFEQVVQELDDGIKKEGLWAKALMRTEGDHNKAYPEYIALRAQAIKDEALIDTVDAVATAAIAARAKAEEKPVQNVEPTVDYKVETVIQPPDFERWGFFIKRGDRENTWQFTDRVNGGGFALETDDVLRLQTALRKGKEKYGWEIHFKGQGWSIKTFLPKTEVSVKTTAEFIVKMEEKIATKEQGSGY